MKFLIILSLVLCTLASNYKSGWVHQNIRSNTQIDPLSSSESDEHKLGILKTQIYNPDRYILVPEPTSHELNLFHQWAIKHNKQYTSEHMKSSRMINVINTIRDIHTHNQRFKEGKETYARALNDLSDLSRTEKEKNILMDLPEDWNIPKYPRQNIHDLPEPRESVDYREEHLVAREPTGAQINCGSSWAFSSAAVLEGQLRKCGISEEAVSVQNMLDCVRRHSDGCNGGFAIDVFIDEKRGGILPASKYPYLHTKHRCSYNKTDILGYVNEAYEYSSLGVPNFEMFMRKIVSAIGPISTVLYADAKLQTYLYGVYTSGDCHLKRPNHAVTIVGYGTDPEFGDYWLFKNSWGPYWGYGGYGKIARGSNLCNFESRIAFAEITDNNGNVCSFD